MSFTDNQVGCWPSQLCDPSRMRNAKPRTTGMTMVMDKGMGINEFTDMLELAHEHIDVIKLGFGTSAVTPPLLLSAKLEAAARHNVIVIPGGTFLEIAVAQGMVDAFFHMMRETGFTGVEVSDGTITLSRKERNALIRRACEEGLLVCTEYGKKDNSSPFVLHDIVNTFSEDLAHGAEWMTLEGRESGVGVGVFDCGGSCDTTLVQQIAAAVHTPNRLMWEAPQKDQQVEILRTIGLDANIGNVSPHDILAFEALRRGLRSDTMSAMVQSHYMI
ncbi:phosphosulfolactate synthase [Paenibacillus sp.]|uniref:phosphosulfolactate synthase n=1 Tax=unclassified Paenibacillus TaxID=185978 RepID=UPI0034641CE9